MGDPTGARQRSPPFIDAYLKESASEARPGLVEARTMHRAGRSVQRRARPRRTAGTPAGDAGCPPGSRLAARGSHRRRSRRGRRGGEARKTRVGRACARTICSPSGKTTGVPYRYGRVTFRAGEERVRRRQPRLLYSNPCRTGSPRSAPSSPTGPLAPSADHKRAGHWFPCSSRKGTLGPLHQEERQAP
jgi:hypothetical protein